VTYLDSRGYADVGYHSVEERLVIFSIGHALYR